MTSCLEVQKPKTSRGISKSRQVRGKTFSLLNSNWDFYEVLANLANQLLASDIDADNLLRELRRLSASGKYAKDISEESYKLLALLQENLSPFVEDVEFHLNNIPLRKRFQRVLRTTRDQYFLHMLEIELVNRLNRENFLQAKHRLAFLPHCLHDLSKECKARVDDDGIDYVCRRCSKDCYIRSVTELLEAKGIKAYIWRQARLKRLFRDLRNDGKDLAVLGMACIPELINGMRLCNKANIPVVGIPLDANRCGRWMDDFYDNSVNLQQLKLLTGNSPR